MAEVVKKSAKDGLVLDSYMESAEVEPTNRYSLQYEMPGEGGYDYEMAGEGGPYGGEREGEGYLEEETEEKVQEEEDEESGSFMELINEPESNVDPQTALEDIKTLQDLLAEASRPKMKLICSLLHSIASGLATGGPIVRAEAIEKRVYETVMKTWVVYCQSGTSRIKPLTDRASAVRHFVMRALVSITPGFPNVLDDVGVEMLMQIFAGNVPLRTQLEALRVLRNVCIRSEKNRERFTDSPGFLDSLCHLIKRSEGEELEQVVREWCGAVKTLVLNDDPRVSYNQAPERKRMIYQTKIIAVIAAFLAKANWEVSTLNAIMVLLGTFAINEEYCLHIDQGSVLSSIYRIIITPQCINSPMLMKNSLACLRYMVFTETIRAKSATMGMIRHVLKLMHIYRGNPDVIESAMFCCFFLTMQNPCQTALFITLGAVNMFIDIMKRNQANVYLLKGGLLTLRNIAINGLNNGRRTILNEGGEDLLNELMKKYPELKQNYVKPVLDELGVVTPDTPSPFRDVAPNVEILKAPTSPADEYADSIF